MRHLSVENFGDLHTCRREDASGLAALSLPNERLRTPVHKAINLLDSETQQLYYCTCNARNATCHVRLGDA